VRDVVRQIGVSASRQRRGSADHLPSRQRLLATGPHIPFRFRSLHELKKQYADNGMFGETTGSFTVLDQSENIVGWFAYFPTAMYVKGLEIGGAFCARTIGARATAPRSRA
jgi:hypothetical protein